MNRNEERSFPKLGYLVTSFPRISETFILNEILEMEKYGIPLKIYAVQKPQELKRHSLADEVRSPVAYLPTPLLSDPKQVFSSHLRLFISHPAGYGKAFLKLFSGFDKDLARRFIQAGVLADLIKKDRIRHLHAGFVHIPGTVAWFVHLMTGIPFSLATHAKDLYHSPENLLRKKFGSAKLVFTCTKYNVAFLNERFSQELAAKVRHFYHGVDLDRFAFGPYAQASPPLILSVARLVEKKGLSDLVKACKILQSKGRVFQCRIIGEGEFRADLEKCISEHHVEDVVFLEGALPQEEVRKWYPQATVFSLPSLITEDGDRDGIPNALVEAAATGVPIVSTGVSGIGELLKHEETGLQVPPRSPAELAKALERLLDSSELRERLRIRARLIVEELFCLKANSLKISETIATLIGE